MILDYSDKQKLAQFLHRGEPVEDAVATIEGFLSEHEHGDGSSVSITIKCENCKRKSTWHPKELADALEFDQQHGWILQCPCTKETWYDLECIHCGNRQSVPESLIEEACCRECHPEWEPTPY